MQLHNTRILTKPAITSCDDANDTTGVGLDGDIVNVVVGLLVER